MTEVIPVLSDPVKEGYTYCKACDKYLQSKPVQIYNRHLTTKGHLKRTGQEIPVKKKEEPKEEREEEEQVQTWCSIF